VPYGIGLHRFRDGDVYVIVIFFNANCFLMYDSDRTCYEAESQTSVRNMATNYQVPPCNILSGVWSETAGLYRMSKHINTLQCQNQKDVQYFLELVYYNVADLSAPLTV
jgi:hypothetical protein